MKFFFPFAIIITFGIVFLWHLFICLVFFPLHSVFVSVSYIPSLSELFQMLSIYTRTFAKYRNRHEQCTFISVYIYLYIFAHMPIPFDGIPFTIQPISESSRKMRTTNDFNCMCDDDDSEIKKKQYKLFKWGYWVICSIHR